MTAEQELAALRRSVRRLEAALELIADVAAFALSDGRSEGRFELVADLIDRHVGRSNL